MLYGTVLFINTIKNMDTFLHLLQIIHMWFNTAFKCFNKLMKTWEVLRLIVEC